jgi:thioredoxin reductase
MSSTRIAILGAGPAGMSCANALLSFGLEPVVIERSGHLGGIQRTNFHPSLWMLGAPQETGHEMTERMSRHFLELPIRTYRNTQVARIARGDEGFRLGLVGSDGAFVLDVAAVVICTGMRARATPELGDLAAHSERVIIGPLSDTIRDRIRNHCVLILGGGDNALDHALFLAERGNHAVVCTRQRFSASQQFQNLCRKQASIELREHCIAGTIQPLASKIAVDWARGEELYDWLLVMYGYQPNIEILDCIEAGIRPRLTERGFIAADDWQRTGVAGIYAAGDITESPQPSVPTAIAQGLAAARAVERQLHDLSA